MDNDKLTRALKREMLKVRFSEDEKQRMASQLKQAMRAQKRQTTLVERAAAFWNGTTEIPVPAAAAALIMIGLGVWNSLSPLLLVDQNAASGLIQASTEKASTISQGVSLL